LLAQRDFAYLRNGLDEVQASLPTVSALSQRAMSGRGVLARATAAKSPTGDS